MKLNMKIKILEVKHWKTSLRYARVGSRAYTHRES